ncbi:hypothetical protein [Glutamicibacter sp. NPDC087344]|uniref:hypothetical protein n=1 Tax=Glutamicibacter sp. NPDC087344 TaxID=3363994 RepID=UPI003807E844
MINPEDAPLDALSQSRIDQVHLSSMLLHSTGTLSSQTSQQIQEELGQLISEEGSVSAESGDEPDIRAAMLAADIYALLDSEPPREFQMYIQQQVSTLNSNMQSGEIDEIGIPVLSAAAELDLVKADATKDLLASWQKRLSSIANDPSLLSAYYRLGLVAKSIDYTIERVDPSRFEALRTSNGLYSISGDGFDPQATYYAREIGLIQDQGIEEAVISKVTATGWISPDFGADLASSYESSTLTAQCNAVPNSSRKIVREYMDRPEKDLLGIFQACSIDQHEDVLDETDMRNIEWALSELIEKSESLDVRQLTQITAAFDTCSLGIPVELESKVESLKFQDSKMIFDLQKYKYLGSVFDLPEIQSEVSKTIGSYRAGSEFCVESPCDESQTDVLATAIGLTIEPGADSDTEKVLDQLWEKFDGGDQNRTISPLEALGLKAIEESSISVLDELIFLT